MADWVAVATGNKRLEYACKPLVMVALIEVAAVIQPAVPAQRAWWLAALALGIVGDVFLMLPRDRFVAGLAAFLVGHLAYIAGFHAAGVPVGITVLCLRCCWCRSRWRCCRSSEERAGPVTRSWRGRSSCTRW
jgi:alkenylglycerophosphocholine/alkenylglycerophosphoethanolamine hydrolase